ncbi:MAG: hypothetical protein EBU84_16640 [Actinobacteria bacterium]|nr:hypothetical protein [Actinomycetota bacterium]
MANQVQWYTHLDATIFYSTLYRSVTGLYFQFPDNIAIGDKLIFAATSPVIQTVTITNTTIEGVAADINKQGKGVKATVSYDCQHLFIRCTAKNNAKFKLLKCTFATKAGQAPRTVMPRTEFHKIRDFYATVNTHTYTYYDSEGEPDDWYRLTTTSLPPHCEESLPTQSMKAIASSGDACTVDGRIQSLDTEDLEGREVSAEVMGNTAFNPNDQSAISEEKITTYTDELGRWALSLTKNQLVLLEIPSIGYNEVVRIPDQAYVLFTDLQPVNDHYYSPDGES